MRGVVCIAKHGRVLHIHGLSLNLRHTLCEIVGIIPCLHSGAYERDCLLISLVIYIWKSYVNNFAQKTACLGALVSHWLTSGAVAMKEKSAGFLKALTYCIDYFKKTNNIFDKRCTLSDRELFQLYNDISFIFDTTSEVTEITCRTGASFFRSLRRVISSTGSG